MFHITQEEFDLILIENEMEKEAALVNPFVPSALTPALLNPDMAKAPLLSRGWDKLKGWFGQDNFSQVTKNLQGGGLAQTAKATDAIAKRQKVLNLNNPVQRKEFDLLEATRTKQLADADAYMKTKGVSQNFETADPKSYERLQRQLNPNLPKPGVQPVTQQPNTNSNTQNPPPGPGNPPPYTPPKNAVTSGNYVQDPVTGVWSNKTTGAAMDTGIGQSFGRVFGNNGGVGPGDPLRVAAVAGTGVLAVNALKDRRSN
jgi:hypothetical protein